MKNIIAILLIITLSLSSYGQDTIMLSVEQCKEMALQQSEDMKIASNAATSAQYDKDIAFSNYLPKVDGSAMGLYVSPDIDLQGNSLVLEGMYTAGFMLRQPVYAGGKVRTANKLASLGIESSKEQQRVVKAEVLANVQNSYWNYIAVIEKINLIKAYEEQLNALQNQIDVAHKSGMSTENDYLQVSAKLSEIKYQMLKVKNGANLLRMSLCYATGLPPETQIVPTDTVVNIGAIESGGIDLSSRPELKLLDMNIEASEHQIKMKRADYLPQLGLAAGYAWYGNIKMEGVVDYNGTQVPFSQTIDDGIFNAVASLSIPVFHWGEGRKKVRKAQLDLEDAQYEKDKNIRLMNLEATQALNNLNESLAMVDAANFAMKQANENLRVMKSKYNASLAPLTDLLSAQTQWQESNSNLIEAKAQYKIYQIDYLKSVGRLD